jgi:hypothetical protein
MLTGRQVDNADRQAGIRGWKAEAWLVKKTIWQVRQEDNAGRQAGPCSKTRIAVRAGAWLVDNACRQAGAWQVDHAGRQEGAWQVAKACRQGRDLGGRKGWQASRGVAEGRPPVRQGSCS